MSYQTYIQKSGRFKPFTSKIEKVIQDISKIVEEKITIEGVDIIVVDQPDNVIPETGLGGYSPNKNLLYIYTDPDRENFEKIIDTELPRTLAHELHHCARWQSVGYGETLLGAIVSEGLAEHFDIEITNSPPSPWATALNSQIPELLEKAKKFFDDKKYDHSGWFFGSEKDEIPRWTGYTLGFYIVGEYMKKTGKKASELTDTKAELFEQELG